MIDIGCEMSNILYQTYQNCRWIFREVLIDKGFGVGLNK